MTTAEREGFVEMGQKQKSSVVHKILTVLGAAFCVILIPVLVINVTLIVKGFTNKDAVPSIGGTLPLIVLTDSMLPEIESEDLIICKTVDAEDIKVRDVISFFDPAGNGSSIVTHRVIEIVTEEGELFFRTQGDNNNTPDKKLVPADKIVGLYKSRIPNAGHVALFMQTTPGLIVCVVVPIILFVAYDMLRRRMYEKGKKDDTNALLAELEALKAEKAKAEEEKTQAAQESAEDNQ